MSEINGSRVNLETENSNVEIGTLINRMKD